MPHKRQKRSAREAAKSKAGQDNPPTIRDSMDHESAHMSKTAYRILNAETIRKQKRQRDAEAAERPAKKAKKSDGPARPKIKPHESLKAFGQRVEQELQPGIAATAKRARNEAKATQKQIRAENEAKRAAATERKRRAKAGLAPVEAEPAVVVEPEPEQKPELDYAKAPKLRLHDIVVEPPTLSLKRKIPNSEPSFALSAPTDRVPASRAPIGLAQQEAMKAEREGAIARYREMKAAELAAA